jgi:hypothetical protein
MRFLFLDESGPFELHNRAVVVAALSTFPKSYPWWRIEDRLRTVGDGLGWPLHAFHFRLPAYHVVRRSGTPGASPLLNRAALCLRGLDEWQRCCEETPTPRDYRELDLRFKLQFSRQYYNVYELCVQPLLDGLARIGRDIAADSLLDACGIVSAEPHLSRDPNEQPDHDRYVQLLAAAAQRGAELCEVRRPRTRHIVAIKPLAKPLQRTPAGRRVFLTVQELCESLAAHASDLGGSVLYVLSRPVHYDEAVDVRFVFADFVANCAGSVMRNQSTSLTERERLLEEHTGFPFSTKRRDKIYSHISASRQILGYCSFPWAEEQAMPFYDTL